MHCALKIPIIAGLMCVVAFAAASSNPADAFAQISLEKFSILDTALSHAMGITPEELKLPQKLAEIGPIGKTVSEAKLWLSSIGNKLPASMYHRVTVNKDWIVLVAALEDKTGRWEIHASLDIREGGVVKQLTVDHAIWAK